MPITKPYDPDMFAPGFKDLGTPTKGSVIAGNGSTWQKLGVGANGTVLTANSGETTGLEWGVAGGGIYTVVSDEAGLIAALAAQDPLIYIDTSVTATQDYSITEDIEVRVGTNVTLDMNSRSFVVDPGFSFKLCGNGLSVSQISTTINDICEASSTGSTVKVSDIYVSYSSSGSGSIIYPWCDAFLENIVVQCPNNDAYVIQNGDGDLTINNVTLIGGGSSCKHSIFLSYGTGYTRYIDGLFILGQFYQSANLNDECLKISGSESDDCMYNIKIDISSRSLLEIKSGVCGLSCVSNGYIKIEGTYIQNQLLTNVSGSFHTIYAIYTGFSNCDLDIASYCSTQSCRFSNVIFQTSVIGDPILCGFSNCRFKQAISTGAQASVFDGCIFDFNIALNASSDSNIVTGCATALGNSNAGTGNIFGTNVVY